MARIVVGVDGSSESIRALRLAVEEGQLRNADVEAVYVFEPPRASLSEELIARPYGVSVAMGSISPDAPAHHPPTKNEEAHDRAMAHLRQLVTEGLADMAAPAPELSVIAADHPAEGLIGESRTADLLVIGTRGLGGFSGMLLGSVAHQIIQHTKCPMLIIPPED